jgi:hypothetical protein
VLTLAFMAVLYIVFFAAQVAIDRRTGWQLAEAFGKQPPA